MTASSTEPTGTDLRSEARVRVVVVEDDAAMAGGIVRGLKAAGFDVELLTNGAAVAPCVLAGELDILVLDLLLPEMTGFDVLEALRGRTAVPIIVLTARTELEDRLRCFGLGAADFVAKPFFVEELVARIKSRLRVRDVTPPRTVSFEDVVVHLDAHTATADGVDVALTRYELDLLSYLVQRPGRAVTRQQLADHALAAEGARDARTVDSHMARLRKKLGPRGAARLVTVWGIGYRFEPDERAL